MVQQYGEFGFLAFGIVLLVVAVVSVPIARKIGLPALIAYLIGGKHHSGFRAGRGDAVVPDRSRA
jgi:hypothetical protein